MNDLPGQSCSTNVPESQGLKVLSYTDIPYAVTLREAVTLIDFEEDPDTSKVTSWVFLLYAIATLSTVTKASAKQTENPVVDRTSSARVLSGRNPSSRETEAKLGSDRNNIAAGCCFVS